MAPSIPQHATQSRRPPPASIGADGRAGVRSAPDPRVVRRDSREQLMCVACEGEPVRAPAGETVVPSVKLGLVASIRSLAVEWM